MELTAWSSTRPNHDSPGSPGHHREKDMAYATKVESKHTARIACRIIPSASAIGTVASIRNLREAVEGIAEKHQIGGECDGKNGFYIAEFESDTSAELVKHAARDLVRFLERRKDYAAG